MSSNPKGKKERRSGAVILEAESREHQPLYRKGKVLDQGFPGKEKKRRTGASIKAPSLNGKEGQSIPLKHSHSCKPSSNMDKKAISFRPSQADPSLADLTPAELESEIQSGRLDWLFPRDKGYTTVGFVFHDEIFLAADHVPTYENKHGKTSSVLEASEWMTVFLSSYGEEGLSVEMLIGGVEEDGPVLYHVDGKGKMEDCKKKRLFPMVFEYQAVRVAKTAICYGIYEAVVACSFVSVYYVDRAGCKKLISGDYVRESDIVIPS
ncbi:OLC1v1010517C1 [Oldenlandia corymbosa var. corymbosa]|uniref:OLC1v1010517C1 n=1 Tax=Oldenlandia corymbosa var. corymbosa TaxID=529605 RepID=A0AAV1DTW2_OLDCO|nr:OLC1v1010517C1 [Oldenlandia corymbosa var. corymbosa]